MKRFEWNKWGNCIVDNLNGVTYDEYDLYNGNLTTLLNQVSERADRNAEALTDTDKSKYWRWWTLQEEANVLCDDIETEIHRFIGKVWNHRMEYFVEVHDYGSVEITVYQHDLDVDKFEQFVINPLCENYKIVKYSFETYVDVNDEKLGYYEWTIGKSYYG